VELELARVRLHDHTGDDRGTVELPGGWVLEPGDLLVDDDGRLVRVRRLIPSPPGSAIAALAEVVPLYGRSSA
jgi:hypothetical protein